MKRIFLLHWQLKKRRNPSYDKKNLLQKRYNIMEFEAPGTDLCIVLPIVKNEDL